MRAWSPAGPSRCRSHRSHPVGPGLQRNPWSWGGLPDWLQEVGGEEVGERAGVGQRQHVGHVLIGTNDDDGATGVDLTFGEDVVGLADGEELVVVQQLEAPDGGFEDLGYRVD